MGVIGTERQFKINDYTCWSGAIDRVKKNSVYVRTGFWISPKYYELKSTIKHFEPRLKNLIKKSFAENCGKENLFACIVNTDAAFSPLSTSIGQWTYYSIEATCLFNDGISLHNEDDRFKDILSEIIDYMLGCDLIDCMVHRPTLNKKEVI